MNECECGNLKPRKAQACRRCTYLDGRGVRQAEAIHALRVLGPATIGEVASAVGIADVTNAVHVLSHLLAQGRVSKRPDFTYALTDRMSASAL